MYCFTCWSFLLFASSWWFVYCFLVIDTCCSKGCKLAHRMFTRKKDKLFPFIVFISYIVCLGPHYHVVVHKKTYSRLILGSYKNRFLYIIILSHFKLQLALINKYKHCYTSCFQLKLPKFESHMNSQYTTLKVSM